MRTGSHIDGAERPVAAGNDKLPTEGAIVDTPVDLLRATLHNSDVEHCTRSADRFELKVVVPIMSIQDVLLQLRMHPAAFSPIYSPRQVNNIYFDSYDLTALHEAVDGDSTRRKLRLRWYGRNLDAVNATLEYKCKQARYGWKLQQDITSTLDLSMLSWAQLDHILVSEVEPQMRLLLRERPRPVLINQYQREYLRSADDSVRCTVDTKLRSYDQLFTPGPRLTRGTQQSGICVVEFKARIEDRQQLAEVVQKLSLRVSKHSKYASSLGAWH